MILLLPIATEPGEAPAQAPVPSAVVADGSAWLEGVRRQTNFYWNNCLDSLPTRLPVEAARYHTVVSVDVDASGVIRNIRVTTPSGVADLDACVVVAFRIANPVHDPPTAIVGPDGFAHLDDLEYIVEVGRSSTAPWVAPVYAPPPPPPPAIGPDPLVARRVPDVTAADVAAGLVHVATTGMYGVWCAGAEETFYCNVVGPGGATVATGFPVCAAGDEARVGSRELGRITIPGAADLFAGAPVCPSP
jgi:hypothetical protein